MSLSASAGLNFCSPFGRPDDQHFCVSIACDSGAVRSALREARKWLAATGVQNDRAAASELVLAEALNNIVEHAYAETTPERIELKIKRHPESLEFCVQDMGREMPEGRIPDGRPPSVDCPVHSLPEGGFGWFLLRSLSRDLTYRRRDEHNILTFRMPA